MAPSHVRLVGDVTSAVSTEIRETLIALVEDIIDETPTGFHVEVRVEGNDPRELNPSVAFRSSTD
jgi:hypothetical protein